MQKSKLREKIIYRDGIPEQIIEELVPEQQHQYFIWDELIKRMAHLQPKRLIPVVKEIFGKEYEEDVQVEFLSTEYILDTLREGGQNILHSVFADMVIRIDNKDIYHFECQISPQSEMIIRMYEYDSQIALIYGMEIHNFTKETVLEMPRSVILYLAHTKNTPEQELLTVRLPNGTVWEYIVPTMKVQEYTLEMIREKQLYFLIPLTPIRYYSKTAKKKRNNMKVPLTQFLKQCILIISEGIRKGYLSEKEGKDILDFLDRSCKYLFARDEEALKEVQCVMKPYFKLGREIFEEEVTERVTEEVTERVTKQVTQQVTQQVTEDNIRAVIEAEQEEGIEEKKICKKIQRVFGLTEKEAVEKLNIYYK